MTADVPWELAWDSDSDMEPSYTDECADFLPSEWDSESNGVVGETID